MPIYYLIGGMTLAIGLEMAVSWLKGRHTYTMKDTAANLTMSLGEATSVVLLGGLVYQFYWFLSELTPLDMGTGVAAFALCFFIDDFLYYWGHRLSHKVRWMWASHVVHHSSEHYNITVAIRQPWTAHLSMTFLVSVPLILAGANPAVMATVNFFTVVYQYLVHTELVPKLGPVEYVLVTPSHHRVHHGSNPRYLDMNYGATLIFWDKLFGTFVEERDDDPVKFGIVENLGSHNPLRIAFTVWWEILQDMGKKETWRHPFMTLFGPPGWRADGTGKTARQIKQEWAAEQEQQRIAAE
jgi:sterol desaturase/sphingolipid hydroxylase (fatty acid hydroxylase superfamily)